jgi:kynurenine formamidase
MPFPAELAALAERVNNWGRWGDDDEIGTLNLIDDAARRRGVAAAVDGRAFSLALPLSPDGPQMGFVEGRDNPDISRLTTTAPFGGPSDFLWHDDTITMGTQAATHWDGLAHASYRGVLYNGFPDDDLTDGAARCGIDKIDTLVSRGVLLDLPRALGIDRMDGGHPLTPDELDRAVEAAGAELLPGDIVLLRTGHIRYFHEGDRLTYATCAPGPSLRTVEWFHSHDVAAVATDSFCFEVFPCEHDDLLLPVHYLHLVEMGLTQGQNWDLEALADDCAVDGRHTFLLEATPEPVERGFGAPVNPVAIK